MRTGTLWSTDLPCPSCGEDLTVIDNGAAILRAECRWCGHAETFGNATDGGRHW